MRNLETFEERLRGALEHLYDPSYRPSEVLYQLLGVAPHDSANALRQTLILGIEGMRPHAWVPTTARVRRLYGLLSLRYVQDLSQEETAERLGISPRHLRREQPDAIHALALGLCQQAISEQKSPKHAPAASETGKTRTHENSNAELAPTEWRSQLRQELRSLQDNASSTAANVAETINGVVQLVSPLAQRHGAQLKVSPLQPELTAAIHPTALRQTLIKAIVELVQRIEAKRITFAAAVTQRHIEITITGRPARLKQAPDGNLIREILDPQGGSFETQIDGDRVSLLLRLPLVQQNILVVDDNLDMIHLYRRYTMGTRYHIQHIIQGRQIFETIETSRPDAVVLDIMLPGVDGWELLVHLRAHPASRSIPVVVCSVVEEKELAQALGAAVYLVKPVERDEFIGALDFALSFSSEEAPTSLRSNQIAG